MSFQARYQRYKRQIEERLLQLVRKRNPHLLYNPIRYILRAGGKRVRPVLTLLACEAAGGQALQALDAAAAIEVLHSFTLVHDDIMDNAETRRGLQTVHKKWDHNIAILAGDGLVALAYRSLLKTRHPNMDDILKTFTDAFHEVCEGQAFDEEFGSRNRVRIGDYIRMIDKKTAAMMAAATSVGGIIGGGTKKEIRALRAYGEHVGRAFQIQDDLLDVVGDVNSLGKKIGADLREGKKTYLLLKGMERAHGTERTLLRRVVGRKSDRLNSNKGMKGRDILAMKRIFDRRGVLDDARGMVRKNTRRAQQALLDLRPSRAREMLGWFADELVERTA